MKTEGPWFFMGLAIQEQKEQEVEIKRQALPVMNLGSDKYESIIQHCEGFSEKKSVESKYQC